MNDGWYGALKEAVQQQQSQLVWVSEGKVRAACRFSLCAAPRSSSEMPLGDCFLNGLVSVLCPHKITCTLFLVVGRSEMFCSEHFRGAPASALVNHKEEGGVESQLPIPHG